MNTESMDDKLPLRRAGLQSNVVGDELIVYDEPAKRVHALNSTCRFIWERCDGVTTVSDLVDLMQQVFEGATREQLRSDALRTLDRFRTENLIAAPPEL